MTGWWLPAPHCETDAASGCSHPLVQLGLVYGIVGLVFTPSLPRPPPPGRSPLGHAELLPADDGAGAVHGALLQLARGLHAMEQQRCEGIPCMMHLDEMMESQVVAAE